MKTLRFLLIPYSLLLTPLLCSAQIAINNTSTKPDVSAILDLNTGNVGVNKGFLAPQVALTNVNAAAPVNTPATGLMVYSTTAPTGGNGVGYYYWNGTAWTGLGGNGSMLTGSGTNNYVARWTPNGTTLGTGLIVDNGTGVGIGTTAPKSFVDDSGSFGTGIVSTSTTYTLDATSNTLLAAPGTYTVTLPPVAGAARRLYKIVYNGAPDNGVISIKGNSNDNIVCNGSATNMFGLSGGSITLQSNGTNWYIVGGLSPIITSLLNQTFAYTGSLQTWVVPANVTQINITVNGAAGGGLFAGLGAQIVSNSIPVITGHTIDILVGGSGGTNLAYGGGGGGTYIWDATSGTLLIVSGGGGGGGNEELAAPGQTNIGTLNTPTSNGCYAGGTGGGISSGGTSGSYAWDAGGGAGWGENGASGSGGQNGDGGNDPANGGTGGTGIWNGGYGGGGGSGEYCGGGGGGFNGGGAGTTSNGEGGGGGGSYSIVTPSSTGTNSQINGSVIIQIGFNSIYGVYSSSSTAAGDSAIGTTYGVYGSGKIGGYFTGTQYGIIVPSGGGSVGIGTTAPEELLSVNNGLNIDQANQDNGTLSVAPNYALTFGSGSGEGVGSNRTGGGTQFGLDFYTNYKEQITILHNGNVGIGTTAPQSLLDVNGGVAIGSYAGNNAAPSNGMIVSGNVGIGTATPNNLLTVTSSIPKEAAIFSSSSAAAGDSAVGKTYGVYGKGGTVGVAGIGGYVGVFGSSSIGGEFSGSYLGLIVPSGGGSVGIGISTPTTLMQVGDGITSGQKLSVNSIDLNWGQMQIGNPTSNAEASIGFISGVGAFGDNPTSTNGNGNIWSMGAGGFQSGAGKFVIGNMAWGGPVMTLTSAGLMGIRCTSPFYTLDVDGDIRASGSVYYGGNACTNNATAYTKPDYVFERDYKKTYSPFEVEKFILKEGHLPWVTSAIDEKKENKGAVDITRMSFQTLEATENIQMQVIEQQKTILGQQTKADNQQAEIEELKKQNEEQKKENEELKKQVAALASSVNLLLNKQK